MAAGLGFKDFTTGEVLTAADVDGYLMQGVWVFASAAARDAAVTSPQEGNFAYLKDTNVTTYYTGSAWANLGTSASGLTLVDEVSYTSSTTINVNDVFSSTYNNYLILNKASSGSYSLITFRLRVSGTDTSTDYFTQLGYSDNTSIAAQRNPYGTDEIFFSDVKENSIASYNIASPYLSEETNMVGTTGFRTGAGGTSYFNFGSQASSTSFTGFSLLATVAITGKVSIYGYAKE